MGIRGSGKSQRGAALIEMAIVLPLLVMLLLGIFTTARAWQVHNVMDHAAREAARFGATLDPWVDSVSNDAAKAVGVAELSAASVPTGPLGWCVDKGATPCGSTTVIPDTEQVVVRITYPNYRLQFAFFSIDVTLQAQAFARHES